MTQFGLAARERELICDVFRRHPEVTEAKIFGSRAMGNNRPNSDIDLTLWGHLSRSNVSRIAFELDELPLPYLFDVEAYESIQHEPLQAHIDRCGRIFYTRIPEPAAVFHA